MKRRNILIAIIAFFAVILTIAPLAPFVIKATSLFTELPDESFTARDSNDYEYEVIPLDYNTGTAEKAASIRWNQDSNSTPADLTVPSSFTRTVNGNAVTYVVYALSANAFAYCDFETITLPNTIREFKQQAFIGCIELTSITIPYQVTEIQESCFMDCRALQRVRYYDENGNVTTSNNTITTIGDHAFAACAALTTITLPNNLTSIGRSAFQGCISLLNVMFPETALSIASYAFANCASMTIAHVPDSVVSIGSYAFADCAKLTVFFMSDTLPSFDTNFLKLRTATSESTLVKYQLGFSSILVDDYHPDFVFTTNNAVIRVNGATSGTSATDASVLQPAQTEEYATIISYAGDGSESLDFHLGMADSDTGKNLDTLVIPDRLRDPRTNLSYPVAVIAAKAFYGMEFIQKVEFSKDLVKIEEYAFAMCKNIEAANFERCEKLAEVGRYIFRDNEKTTDSCDLKVLRLPCSLKYIDGNAFRYLTKLETLSFRTLSDDENNRPDNLIAIGRYAFYFCGLLAENQDTSNIVLPNTVSDKKLIDLLKFMPNTSKMGEGTVPDFNIDSKTDAYAISAHAFAYSRALNCVTMQDCTCSKGGADYTYTHTCNWASFGAYAFRRTGIRRFISSPCLYRLQKNLFLDSKQLTTVLLHAEKAYSPTRTKNYAGVNISTTVSIANYSAAGIAWKHGVFTRCDNVNVFVNLPAQYADPQLDSRIKNKAIFYRDQDANGPLEGDGGTGSYTDAYLSSDFPFYDGVVNSKNPLGYDYNKPVYGGVSRFDVPVYFGQNFSELMARIDDPIQYVEKTDSSGNKYTCITNYIGTATSLDLQSFANACVTRGAPVKEIGSSAFAYNDARKLTVITNLPDTIETIGDYAFYSRSSNTRTYESFTRVSTTAQAQLNKSGTKYSAYCLLPTSLKTLGRKAFVNHQFQYIRIPGSNLTSIGAGAFQVTPLIGSSSSYNSMSKLKAFDFNATSEFFVENENIYYQTASGKYALIQNIPYDLNDGTNTLSKNTTVKSKVVTVKSGTYAIASQAMEGLAANEVNLPSSLTTIYGYAFSCTMLEKVSGDLSNIKYIGSPVFDSDTEAILDDEHFINSVSKTVKRDSKKVQWDQAGAFRKCRRLKSFNFRSMSSLVGLGDEEFLQCDALEDMFGNNGGTSVQYIYKTYNATTKQSTVKETLSKNVVDLSAATNMRLIGYNCFKSCSKMKYFHTPSTAPRGQESKIKVSEDIATSCMSGTTAIVGERANQANKDVSGLNSSTHYLAKAFNGLTAYFYAETADDIIPKSLGKESIKYWTHDPSDTTNRTFILLDNAAAARSFFNVADSYTPAS